MNTLNKTNKIINIEKNNTISIEWLNSSGSNSIDNLKYSNLASIRLRTFVAAQAACSAGFQTVLSDGESNKKSDIIVVGKIDYISDKNRPARWLSQIKKQKENKTKIIIDYTDHHLESDTLASAFYRAAIPLADFVVCSSKKLKQHISRIFGLESIVIEDPIEVPILKPIYKNNSLKTILWFGHASNLDYLINCLEEYFSEENKARLILMTNAFPLPDKYAKRLDIPQLKNIEINVISWSKDDLIAASKISDFCIIPTGFNDPRKNGASANRLLTSLALGLPTLTDSLDSYQLFSDYYYLINKENISRMIENPEINENKFFELEKLISEKYTQEIIGKNWISLIKNINLPKKVKSQIIFDKNKQKYDSSFDLLNDMNNSCSQNKDNMTDNNNLTELIQSWKLSPFPSTKITTYFSAYAELFSHLRNKNCVFIETGVLGGGSLFMWRNWLGPKARIIGIDLNPEANRWKDFGFEIFIGDQGDPFFWKETLKKIGKFDVLLDDGGHQSFQQIITVQEAIRNAAGKCIIAIEDTHTSFMKDFQAHGLKSFLNYAKDSTDILTARGSKMYPNRFKKVENEEIIELFNSVHSIQFFNSLVAFKVDSFNTHQPSVIWNKRDSIPSDFRYHGKNEADALWPDPFKSEIVTIQGGLHESEI